jgi:hypothetical protein
MNIVPKKEGAILFDKSLPLLGGISSTAKTYGLA